MWIVIASMILIIATILSAAIVLALIPLKAHSRKCERSSVEGPIVVYPIASDCWDRTALPVAGATKDSATFSCAAVAADAAACSTAGKEMLLKGGSAVDAAIAAQLCLGVVNLHSTGIGGGGFMVYYNASSRESYALDFRGVAPLNASTLMYNGTAPDSHIYGGLSIALPSEIRGLGHAWKKFGKLEWHELFDPAITLARDGFPISKPVAKAIAAMESHILFGKYPGLKELLAPQGKILREGDILKRPLLAQTLQDIADNGADHFYSGSFLQKMIEELQENDSIFEVEDFVKYSAIERDVTVTKFKGCKIHGVSAPGGGPVVGQILNILDGCDLTGCDRDGLSTHRTIEAMKYAYAQRFKLGDPTFNNSVNQVVDYMVTPGVAERMMEQINDSVTSDPDHYVDTFKSPLNAAHDNGTSHLSVLAENGDAVALTSSVNSYFGSLVRSQTSGIIFNNMMADFNIPGRHCDFNKLDVNFIEPGKKPLSSMAPTIVTDDDGVKLVVGASGGSRIITAVAQVILNVFGKSLTLKEAIYRPRLHHQLIPNQVLVESDFPSNLRKSLESKGHVVENNGIYAVVQGIHVVDGVVHATSDPRKGGRPDGY